MRQEDIETFSNFLGEFQGESDRGAALVGAALVDARLERLLTSHMLDGKAKEDLLNGGNAPIGTFSARSKLSHALGLITDVEFSESEIIRKVRNEFAHAQHGLKFENEKIAALCNNLKANTPDGKRFEGKPRPLFISSVIMLSLALWYRPEYAEKFKAQPHQWDWRLVE